MLLTMVDCDVVSGVTEIEIIEKLRLCNDMSNCLCRINKREYLHLRINHIFKNFILNLKLLIHIVTTNMMAV